MADIPIAEIVVGKRHRKAAVNIDALAASIQEVGLLQPVVITPEKKLVAGFRRIRAFQQLGRDKIPTMIAKSLDETVLLLKAERDENTCREPFSIEEAVAMGESIERLERPRAQQRMLAGRRCRSELPCGKLPQGKTLDVAASSAGLSRHTYERAKTVVDAAKAEPKKFRNLVDEMNRTGKVNGVFKRLQTAKAAENIKAEPPPMPKGPFRVLVVDPPWQYEKRAEDPSHRGSCPYPTMTVDELKAMPVPELACKDSILWLWTTNAFMREAYDIADKWGFTVKTILTWAKTTMGTGDWLRGKTEHCLMCIRGKPTITLTNQTTLLEAKKQAHSQKPEEFYSMVDDLCPGSKCELFQRTPRKGWVGHGNEVK